MMKYLVGLDIGTSSVKGVLLTTEGKEVKTAREPFNYSYPFENYVEISAEEYADACMKVLRSLREAAEGEIIAVSEASASGNLLLLDADMKPITPIINWQDARVTTEVSEILGEDFDSDEYYDKIGWPLGAYMPLSQLCYIKKHNPKILEKAAKVCMSTEYLNFLLTGQWGIGTSAGTPFFLINQKTGKYNKDVLLKLGIDEDKLPPVMKTGSVFGEVTEKGEKLSSLPEGTKVVLGTFDHPSAARAAGILEEGQLLLSCGTSWVGFFPVKKREKVIENNLLCDPFLDNEGIWGAMFSVPSISTKIDSYIKEYIDDTDNRYKTLEEYAKKASEGKVKFTLQDNDHDTLKNYPKEEIALAIMESVAYILKDRFETLKKSGITFNSAVMAGGPSESRFWVSVIERILGITIKVSNGVNTGAVGAATIAGIGAGIYVDERDALKKLNIE